MRTLRPFTGWEVGNWPCSARPTAGNWRLQEPVRWGWNLPAPELQGALPRGERARQANSPVFFRILPEGGAKQGKPAPRPRLEKNGNARRASRSTPEEVQREDLARPSSMARASTCWIG